MLLWWELLHSKIHSLSLFKEETLVCVHPFGNFPFSWNGRTHTVILNLPGTSRVLFCKWHSVPTQWSSVECVWASLSSSHHKHVNHAFHVHARSDRVDQVLIPEPGGKCCRRTLLRSSFIVLAVCVCWQTEWRRSVWYLYIPLWYHSLCGACLSRWKPHCSRLSSFLTSPVSWSSRPRRILLHSSAWVKIFSSFPPSAHPQITSVLVYRQSTVVPPASYPPSLLCWW